MLHLFYIILLHVKPNRHQGTFLLRAQLEKWCEDGNKLATSATTDLSSMDDLERFMETHGSLNLDEIWTSEATYVHVITPCLLYTSPSPRD